MEGLLSSWAEADSEEHPRVGTVGEGSLGLGAIPELVGDTAFLLGEQAQRGPLWG